MIFTGAVLARAFFQLCAIAFLARFGGAEQVGDYATALSLASPIVIFAELGFRNIYASQKKVPSLRKAFVIRFCCLAVAVALIVALGLMFFPLGISILLAFGLAKSLESILDLTFVVYQRDAEMRRPATAIFSTSLVGIISFCVIYFYWRSVALGVLGMACGTALVLAAALPNFLKRLRGCGELTNDKAPLGWLLRAGGVTGGAQFLGSLGAYLPIYYLASSGDSASAGLYSVLSYFLVIAQLVLSAVQQIRLSEARSLSGNPKAIFTGATLINSSIVAFLIFGTSLTLFLGIDKIFGSEFQYSLAQALLLLLAMSTLPIVYAATTVMLVEGKFSAQIWSILGALAMAASFFWIPVGRGPLDGAVAIAAIFFTSRAIGAVVLLVAFYGKRRLPRLKGGQTRSGDWLNQGS